MSEPKTIVPDEDWVFLYSELSHWIHEYCSLDPIWTIDENGNEVRTEEKEDEFLTIVDEVESMMERVLIKESEVSNEQ